MLLLFPNWFSMMALIWHIHWILNVKNFHRWHDYFYKLWKTIGAIKIVCVTKWLITTAQFDVLLVTNHFHNYPVRLCFWIFTITCIKCSSNGTGLKHCFFLKWISQKNVWNTSFLEAILPNVFARIYAENIGYLNVWRWCSAKTVLDIFIHRDIYDMKQTIGVAKSANWSQIIAFFYRQASSSSV